MSTFEPDFRVIASEVDEDGNRKITRIQLVGGSLQFCTRPAMAGDFIGHPCPDCGHTNLVHPGASNPALRHCVLCELTARPRSDG